MEIGEERISRIEERMSKLEGVVSQMDKRLDDMNKRLNHLGEEVVNLRREMAANFRWTVALIFGMWVTIMGGIGGLITLVK